MSDIQEEQKRLYKRAKENDKENWIDISKENRRLLKKIHNIEIKELQDRINKAIEYIREEQQKIDEMGDNYCYLDEYEINDLLNILKGDNK